MASGGIEPARASARAYWVMASVAGVALGALGALHWQRQSSELFPDAEVLRYRFVHAAKPAPGPPRSDRIRALEARERAPAGRPLDALELSELAELYLQEALVTGDPSAAEKAEATARRSLAVVAWPNPATLTLAKLANAKHEFRASIALAEEALARKNSTSALLVLSSSHLALGELSKATDAAESAVELHPESSTYLARALTMQAAGRDVEAAFDFSRAALAEDFSMRDDSAKLRALWARLLMGRGELPGARLLLDEALRIVPGHALALALQGELSLRQGHLSQACSDFQNAFESSKQLRYLSDEARARELSHDMVGADALRAQVERIIRAELATGNLGHRLELVETLVDRGKVADLPEARKLAYEELAKRPSADVRFQLARALHRSGETQHAQEQVRAILATGVHDARVFTLAAILEKKLGSASRAELYENMARSLDPGGSGWRMLGLGELESSTLLVSHGH